MIEIRPVSMAHEMYNDGLYFYEKAKEETNFGDVQRCYRFAIVSFASSFEAFINAQLKSKLEVNVTTIPNGANILNFLINGGRPPEEIGSIHKKIKILEQLYNVNNQLINSSVFKKFYNEIIVLRNAIVHYSSDKFTSVYQNQINIAVSDGAKLLTDTIRHFVNILPIKFPPYYSNQMYKPIE
ncbi:hypothetical protein LZ480_13535 [Solibacillus sp. MA9]|uniref:RiboL-PSP-HEPN domain-containing protein n=1 Tax=Solibacillus palustris TaxID=2908203 RepID=A0ABS9UG24_9BACL|nr:hypothetical protein [Solibacillus sp. MA9]MCH7322898.1 hypothetical protein [Solibacillus sp. MA9]